MRNVIIGGISGDEGVADFGTMSTYSRIFSPTIRKLIQILIPTTRGFILFQTPTIPFNIRAAPYEVTLETSD